MQDSPTDRNRLESWKQIAAYLQKSERTVRRWHETEALPVHKHLHQLKGSVWAYADELDEWLARRTVAPETQVSAESPESPANVVPKSRHKWLWMGLAIATAALLLAVRFRPAGTHVRAEPVPLTTLPGMEYGATMSPDGKRIAFHWSQAREPLAGIYLKDLDKDAVTPLAVSQLRAAFLYNPSFSPDGSTIAFLERTAAGETWLCTIPASGGQHRRLKQIAAPPVLYFGNYNHISWSHDGRGILVPISLHTQQGIYRVSVDSGSSVAIVQGPSLYSPALSPDGRRLVSFRHEGLPITSEEIQLYELKPDGFVAGGPTLVYKGHSGSSGITWMSDSRHLVLCMSEPTMLGPLNGRLLQFPAVAGATMKEIGGEGCNTISLAPDGFLIFAKPVKSTQQNAPGKFLGARRRKGVFTLQQV